MNGNSYLNLGNHPFYVHFIKEHQRIDGTLRNVRNQMHQQPFHPRQLAQHMNFLRETILQHFHEEEEGCFDELVAQSPYLASEARQIEQQHQSLMIRLDELIELVTEEVDSVAWVTQFDQFQEDLAHHETRERDLVRRGLLLTEEDG